MKKFFSANKLTILFSIFAVAMFWGLVELAAWIVGVTPLWVKALLAVALAIATIIKASASLPDEQREGTSASSSQPSAEGTNKDA